MFLEISSFTQWWSRRRVVPLGRGSLKSMAQMHSWACPEVRIVLQATASSDNGTYIYTHATANPITQGKVRSY